MAFAREELIRYSRHILVPEIGAAGQEALRRAHVVLLGRGEAARVAATYLAAAGVGRLSVFTRDRSSPDSAIPPHYVVPPGVTIDRLPEPADAPSLAALLADVTVVCVAGADDLIPLVTFAAARSSSALVWQAGLESPALEGALVAARATASLLSLTGEERAP